MAGERTVKIKFVGDTTQLRQAGDDGERTIKKFGTGVAQVAGGIAALGIGSAIFDWGKETIASLGNIERLRAQTNAALKSMNVSWTDTASLEAYADKIEKATGIEAEMVQEGQNLLLTFGNIKNVAGAGNQVFDRATTVLADMSVALGQDVSSSAVQLGKALNDPIAGVTALSRVGVSFTDAQKDQIKALTESGETMEAQKLILSELERQFGGSAVAFGETMPGQLAKAKNAFGEVSEGIVGALLPSLTELLQVGLKVIGWIGDNKEIVLPLIGVIAAVTAVQWAWNIAMTANPIGLIIVGVAALIAAIVWIATKTTWFQDIWNAAWGWIKNTAIDVWEWMQALPDKIGNVFSAIGNFITAPFRWAFNFIADAWNNTIGSLRWSVPDWVPFIGGNTIAAPQLRKFHSGGVVPGPFGKEVPILARAGEEVLTAEQRGRNVEVRVFIGDQELRDMVRVEVGEVNRGTRRRVLAGAGAR